jgi:hypothetical protein
MPKLYNLVGHTFGRLGVYGLAHMNGGSHWQCVCVCGKELVRYVAELRPTSSCGCGRIKHGGHGTAEYKAWEKMKHRCQQPSNPRYVRYGGRGISVCQRWMSYENFIADMGRRPSHRHSLERINNDGNYEPANCRWATPAEQMQNTKTTKLITFGGVTLSMAGWAKKLGLAQHTLTGRIHRGWTLERVLTPPLERGRRMHARPR